MLAALAHAAVLSEVPPVPASQLTARLEEVYVPSGDILLLESKVFVVIYE